VFLFHLFRHIIDTWGKPVDLAEEGVAQSVIDKCFDTFCSPPKPQSSSLFLQNLHLRIRDFGTVIEAEEAMQQGDIGRLFVIYQMWALMAHGVQGLPRYALHLTRFILLVEQDLPPALAKVIKHSLLIPSEFWTDHWIGNDLWLEIQNYWLKGYFKNGVNPLHHQEKMNYLINTCLIFLSL
jgi:hypothetical protein